MDNKLKSPLNVDLKCDLRVMGYSKSSFTFETDEGDGYEIYENYIENEEYSPKLESKHFEEWAKQLNYFVDWLNQKATELKKKENKRVVRSPKKK
jgi:hypothetical protein